MTRTYLLVGFGFDQCLLISRVVDDLDALKKTAVARSAQRFFWYMYGRSSVSPLCAHDCLQASGAC